MNGTCSGSYVASRLALCLAFVAFTQPTLAQQGLPGSDSVDRGISDENPVITEIRYWQEQEELGVQLYKSGDYDRAYEILAETARRGFKDSQHAMALMHLKGQGVDKNPLKGTALLGLAAESGEKRRVRQYEQLLKKIPDVYRDAVLRQVAFYIERYGMQTQGVACSMKKRPQSHLRAMECVKQPGYYEEYLWEP